MKNKIVCIILLLNSILVLSAEPNCLQNRAPLWFMCHIDGKPYLIRGNRVDSIPHEIDTLIAVWNKSQLIKLHLYKINSDTVYIKLKGTDAFTQIGSIYITYMLAEIVFSITEDKRYTNVFLDFEETDHAPPGMYSRKYFEQHISFVKQKTHTGLYFLFKTLLKELIKITERRNSLCTNPVCFKFPSLCLCMEHENYTQV